MLVALAFYLHSHIHTVADFYAMWTLLGVGLAGTLYPPAFAVLTRHGPHAPGTGRCKCGPDGRQFGWLGVFAALP
jgi:hypothetical protein